MNFSTTRSIAFAMLLPVLPAPLGGATIFDNSRNDLLTRFDPGAAEVGDQIILAGTERYLTGFSFEFWGTNTTSQSAFSGDVQARVRFYENDGSLYNGYAAPGHLLYDSQWFSIGTPTPRSTMVFEAGQALPETGLFLGNIAEMTWSIQFQGLGSTDQAGLDLYSPPITGQDYPDYWQLNAGVWELMTNAVPMDFAARFEASATPVPEPAWPALVLLAGSVATFSLGVLRKKAERACLSRTANAKLQPSTAGDDVRSL